MTTGKRALCYVLRKRVRTAILLITFSITCVCILGTAGIRSGAEAVLSDLKKNADSKLILESPDPEAGFTEEDVWLVRAKEGVNKINRAGKDTEQLSGIRPLPDDQGNATLTVHRLDDVEHDSPFEDKSYRLVEGDYPKDHSGILLNQFLAEINGIHTGDQAGTGYVVTGLFISGTERQQTEHVSSENRIENQVFTGRAGDPGNGTGIIHTITCYLNDPEDLPVIMQSLREDFGSTVSIREDDHLYLKIKRAIKNTEQITFFVQILSIVTGCVVTLLLLFLWMRDRKREIAVFRALGISRFSIAVQFLIETELCFFLSFPVAAVMVHILLPELINGTEDLYGVLSSAVHDMGIPVGICAAGAVVVLILSAVALFPWLTKKPREILSEMEG